MNRAIPIALILGCCLAASPWLRGQSPAPQNAGSSSQNQPPGGDQKPAPKPATSPSNANSFPEDTTSVPVIPSTPTPVASPPADSVVDNSIARLPGEDYDPVRSPDDPAPDAGSDSGFSSSLQGMNDLKPPPDDEKPGKHQRVQQPTHQEGPAEDVNIGEYYLERKNWRAALSRFESALVLDPENPEVYWGLAEAQRELGDYANARVNYQKLLDYDPDGKHGKEARKALKEPQIANAPKPATMQPAPQAPQ